MDLLFAESEIVIEYSKIDPFVYLHSDRAQTYMNYDYVMGHWIGSNADQWYYSFSKKIIRGMEIKNYYLLVRKGSVWDYSEMPYQTKHSFLWGLKRYYNEYGLKIEYEVIHTLFARMVYRLVKDKIETSKDIFNITENHFFSFGLSYGI